jgi:hypothetical protein
MGNVVDFVGSDQPGHPVSFIVEVVHGGRGSISRYIRAGAGTMARLCPSRALHSACPTSAATTRRPPEHVLGGEGHVMRPPVRSALTAGPS